MPLQQYDFADDPLHATPVYPEKITLQLKPKTISVSESLKKSGYNTVLNLTFKPTKSIASIIQHLQKKWVKVVNGMETSIASSSIRLYPCLKPEQEGNTILSTSELERGWGIESGVTVLQIYQQLGFPQPFQLQYWWNSDVPSFIMPHANNDVSSDVMSQNVIGSITQIPLDDPSKLPRNMHQILPSKQVSLVNAPYKMFKKNLDSSIPHGFLPSEESCDGFSSKVWDQDEKSCRDFYHNFEDPTSQDGFEHTDPFHVTKGERTQDNSGGDRKRRKVET